MQWLLKMATILFSESSAVSSMRLCVVLTVVTACSIATGGIWYCLTRGKPAGDVIALVSIMLSAALAAKAGQKAIESKPNQPIIPPEMK